VREPYKGGSTGSEICYERSRGFCRQRSGWVEHWLANQFYEAGEAVGDASQKLERLERALMHTTASLRDFPNGFEQMKPSKWLQQTLPSEIGKLKGQ
jgi:hypothetical protein